MHSPRVVQPLFVHLVVAASLVPSAADASRTAGRNLPAVRVAPVAAATVDFRKLAEAARSPVTAGAQTSATADGPAIPFVIASPFGVGEPKPDDAAEPITLPDAPIGPTVASPPVDYGMPGGTDAVKVGTGTWVVPPGVDGAVGPTRVISTLNNNFVIADRSANVLSTVSIDTFWAATGAVGAYDTRALYDAVNDRFVVAAVSNAGSPSSSVLVGITTTGDPGGTWSVARFDADAPNTSWADFPQVGLHPNWFAVTLTMVPTAGGASTGRMFVLDYPAFRAGTASATIFDPVGVCAAPAMTYGASSSMSVPRHLVSSTGTYALDTITGTGALPVYTTGGTRSRGVTWTQPTGIVLPQKAPISGASACGTPACAVEAPDAQIRTTPIARGGAVWYAQTVGLPAGGFTHTGILWTKLDAATGAVLDGGLIEDPAATQASGAWYAYPALAVNANGDAVITFTRFAADSFPSAAYATRRHGDAAGVTTVVATLRAGADYYNRELLGGRNRWGDYSKAQVDPNDVGFWVQGEYAASRASTDDTAGTTNGSRWATWWGHFSGAIPGEAAPGAGGSATSLRFADSSTLVWPATAGATGYRVYRGIMADLPKLVTSAPESCLRGTSATASLSGLNEVGGPGGMLWYLVTAESAWGEGTVGSATGMPRSLQTTGNCP